MIQTPYTVKSSKVHVGVRKRAGTGELFVAIRGEINGDLVRKDILIGPFTKENVERASREAWNLHIKIPSTWSGFYDEGALP